MQKASSLASDEAFCVNDRPGSTLGAQPLAHAEQKQQQIMVGLNLDLRFRHPRQWATIRVRGCADHARARLLPSGNCNRRSRQGSQEKQTSSYF